jgi:hypothetical protein
MEVFEMSPGLAIWSLLTFAAVVVLWLVPCALAAWQASERERSTLLGAVLGLFLGWVGFAIVMVFFGPVRGRA